VPLEKNNRSKIPRVLEGWFLETARTFPWRTVDTPWGRLISEFMAQQTQIERVAERWPSVVARFPTPESMAKSDEQEILALWQGLGYYRRARHLKASAELICKMYSGVVPDTVEELLTLPGVGKYTAGAIASIAYGKREPIVDANVHRVLCRISNRSGDPVPSEWTWEEASKLALNCDEIKIFNEALMEFGAVVCSPKKPDCMKCPLQNSCASYKSGTQFEVPTPKEPAKKKKVFHYAVVMEHGDELAFEQRGDKGLWSRMWQVPTVESTVELTSSQVAVQLGVNDQLKYLDTIQHSLSHRSISLSIFSCKCARDARFHWFQWDSLAELPLASAQRKVLAVHYLR
jgi:A/G-specific adenine glycosylase